MGKVKNDLTEGDLGKNILLFAMPLAATGILQQLFNAADIAVLGRYVGSDAMAAVGSNTPLTALIINLFVGISIGANVVIAHYIGMGNREKVTKAVHTSLLIAVLSGAVIAAICELIAPAILGLLSIPDEVYDMALLYFRVYIMGMPVVLLYDFASAIFRSRGNTRTPLICLLTSGIVNVILNLFFVLVLKMTVNGVALATVLANLISSALLVWFLMHEESEIRVDFNKLLGRSKETEETIQSAGRPQLIDAGILGEMIKIGLPAGLQGMVFCFSNVIIQSAINKLGADVMAGSSAAFNIEIFAYYVLNSFGQACTTFTGQNYGANKPERCRKVLQLTLLQDMLCAIVLPLVILFFGRPLLGIFNSDPNIIATGMVRLRYILLAEFINVIIEIFSGYMRGFGYSLFPALTCTVCICGVRLTWVYSVFEKHQTFPMLMTCYPISWGLTAVVMLIVYFYMRNKYLADFFAQEKQTK